MKKYVKIEGITCNHCKKKIKESLLQNKNIIKVQVNLKYATIECNEKLKNSEIIKAIKELDYFTKEEYISENEKNENTKIKLTEFLMIAISFILINCILYKLFGYNIFNVIPTIDSSITYGMLFLIGFLTSIHCISMCGAINLMAIYNEQKIMKKPLFYNFGRLISYTFLGGIVGFLGKVLEINKLMSGLIVILASVLMFLLSLKMLGIFDFQFICFVLKLLFI